MKKHLMNYETLLKITKAMSMSRDPEEIILLTVESIKKTLNIKGCALFLVNPDSNELELVASKGLSKRYLNKGPVSSLESIANSLQVGRWQFTMLQMIREYNIPKPRKKRELPLFCPYRFMSGVRSLAP